MTLLSGDHRPIHHPDEGVLLDFASGASHEAGAVLIASHLALCRQCRETVKQFESLGGALIEDLPPSALTPGSRDAVMARLHERPQERAAPQHEPVRVPNIPAPLRDYVSAELRDLPWQRLGLAIDQVELPLRGERAAIQERLRLMRIRAGATIPRHTHQGTEMILVLSGGFRDGPRQFQRGDFSLSDQQVDHSPQVDSDGDCICLSVTDAPLRFTGLFGRIFNLFVRF